MGQQIAETFQDYVMNINVLEAQFDPALMLDEANKLGLDFGDLKDYGYDPKNSKCAQNACSH